jgi:phosphoglucosamine mutase
MVMSMLRFGTDGVRGRVGIDLVEEHAELLGVAVAQQWPRTDVVIGHDGRESGESLVAAFSRGAAGAGAAITNVGLLPTPALARLAARRDCVAVSVTASHNPWYDNGIKVFAPGGRKLTDDEQQRIERRWHSLGKTPRAAKSTGTESSDTTGAASVGAYVQELVESLGIADFAGQRVVLDCANGATSQVAPAVMSALGLQIETLNAAPNGRNINDGCGAVHPEQLAQLCVARSVIGVAFDGDGDRLIAVDESGTVVDGDRIIALMAADLHSRGLLTHDTVVVTSMTNLGFHRAMQRLGINVVTTDVGDRAVLAAMEDGGYVLGGEQSGHIINALHATTGDGVLAAVLLLDLVRRSKSRLTVLADAAMQRMPQVLRNVKLESKPANIDALISDELHRERTALGDEGRIVVRVSGTEPVIRVMVEASSLETAHAVAERLEHAVLARTQTS